MLIEHPSAAKCDFRDIVFMQRIIREGRDLQSIVEEVVGGGDESIIIRSWERNIDIVIPRNEAAMANGT
jgi:hypothetical protein